MQPNIEPNSLFTAEISQAFKSLDWPRGLKARIYERWSEQTGDPYLQLVLFADNFESFDGEDRLQIAMMVKELMEKVRKQGVPFYLKVEKGDGRAPAGMAN